MLVADRTDRMANFSLCVLGNPYRCASAKPVGERDWATAWGRILVMTDCTRAPLLKADDLPEVFCRCEEMERNLQVSLTKASDMTAKPL